MAITIRRCYAINRSTNAVYYSDDYGTTWSQFVSAGLSTTSASDIDVNPIIFDNMMVLNGATTASTPYLSIDEGATFASGANIAGKEIHYVSSSGIVVGGKRLKTNTGPTLYISTNGGVSFIESIDTTSLFSYPGAVYSNITVMDVDFTTSYGGYIAIAGNQDNSSADSLLTRTYNLGNTFPDTIILPGSQYGVIRCVFGNPYGKVVFAAGEPGLTNRGKLYIIDKTLTDIPVEVLSGITVGDSTNTTITKFFTVPSKDRNRVFFIDSDGSLYKSSNGGETWVFASDVPGNCVDILAANESIIIALTNSPSAIYKSVDAGSTWTEVLQPSWTNPEALAYNELASCESCPSGYTVERSGFDINSAIYCSSYNYMGPLCKPPYQYLAVDKTCVSPSTVVPSNIVYLIDKSGSVDAFETEKIGLLLRKLTLDLSDRLATGAIEIAIVTFATGVCTHLEFTSDQDLIISKVLNLDECYTPFQNNHILGFCTATRLLYEKSIQRPNAKNTMILLTDGSHYGVTGICDLSDIGLQPVVTPTTANRPWIELAADAKANLAGIGMDMFCVVYGSLGERNQMYDVYIQDPLNNNYEPLPTRTPRGNYYYFDISNNDLSFTDIIANQIRLGLSSDSFIAENCPDGCTSVPGIDNLGYCECPDRIDVVPCLYKFTDCSNIIPPFYYFNSLFATNDGKTVRLGNPNPNTTYYQPGCFKITTVLPADIPSVPVDQIINPLEIQIPQGSVFNDCPACQNVEYYKFTDCTNPNRFIYSGDTGLGFQLSIGPVWKSQIAAYRNTCWRGEFIGAIDPPPAEAITGWRQGLAPIVLGSNPSQTCLDCTGPVDVPSYKCTDCENIVPPVYTENDFSIYGGKIIKLLQYPDVCWNVSVNVDQNFAVENLTVDGVTFLTCQECLPVAPLITYTLTSCDDPTNQIATDSNLDQYIGGTVRLTTTGDICWNVTSGSLPNLVLQPVSVSQSFVSCQDCYPQIYSFTDCQNPNNKVYTLIDFSAYQGQTLRLQEYPGVCWVCGVTDDRTLPRQDVTINGDPYASCQECVVSYYQLTNCANENVYLISTTDLSRYVNRVITAAGYPSLCFTVTEPKCECIKLTVNDIDYNVSAQPNLFNGRYSYAFTSESGDSLSLAWSINPNRWELFNSNTLEIYCFSTADTQCPFSNFWTIQQGSSYIVNRVTFCPDDIYAISPELDFADCLPCIKCI
jgi:hypothetical protein